jgi:2-C-methyl-D-erythritol 4-phosphate cytidylyltransferase
MPAAVVILAGGSGTRVGAAANKVLLPMGEVPVLVWSVRAALAVPEVDSVVVVVRPGEEGAVATALAPHLGDHEVILVPGGPSRHVSEWHGIRAVASLVSADQLDVVVVHDAARPLAGPDTFAAVIAAAREHGAALPVVRLPGLLTIELRSPGAGLVAVQTPQAFRAPALLEAHRRAAEDGFEGTDTASVVERYADLGVVAVPGSTRNLKITFPEDVAGAAALASRDG